MPLRPASTVRRTPGGVAERLNAPVLITDSEPTEHPRTNDDECESRDFRACCRWSKCLTPCITFSGEQGLPMSNRSDFGGRLSGAPTTSDPTPESGDSASTPATGPAPLMSTTDVARRLGFDGKRSADRVVAFIRSGRLGAYNVGNGRRPEYRISENDLQAFLDGSRVGPPPPKPAWRRRRPYDGPRLVAPAD
jgi:hypothetical protein